MSFWERHLPWALLKVLQTFLKSKRHLHRGGGSPRRVRGRGGVCLRGARNATAPGERASAIAVRNAGRPPEPGRAGRPSSATGLRRRASRSATDKAGATGSASGIGNRLRPRPLREPRGSSLENFFSCSCDRPGCYVEFDRSRRSPLQRFCCLACRHALKRVLQRERRWRERHCEPARGKSARRTGWPLRR